MVGYHFCHPIPKFQKLCPKALWKHGVANYWPTSWLDTVFFFLLFSLFIYFLIISESTVTWFSTHHLLRHGCSYFSFFFLFFFFLFLNCFKLFPSPSQNLFLLWYLFPGNKIYASSVWIYSLFWQVHLFSLKHNLHCQCSRPLLR